MPRKLLTNAATISRRGGNPFYQSAALSNWHHSSQLAHQTERSIRDRRSCAPTLGRLSGTGWSLCSAGNSRTMEKGLVFPPPHARTKNSGFCKSQLLFSTPHHGNPARARGTWEHHFSTQWRCASNSLRQLSFYLFFSFLLICPPDDLTAVIQFSGLSTVGGGSQRVGCHPFRVMYQIALCFITIAKL